MADQTATPEERIIRARRRVRDFLVAGAAGAFLSTIARTLPADLQGQGFPGPYGPDYKCDLIERYAYMFWLMIYFLISSLSVQDDKEHLRKDICFDLFQTFFALAAIYELGFVNRGFPQDWRVGYTWANSAICVICALALLLYRNERSKEKPKLHILLNVLRGAGLVFSGAGIYICLAWGVPGVHPSAEIRHWLGFLLGLLAIVLVIFFYIRWTTPPPDRKSNAATDCHARTAPVVEATAAAGPEKKDNPQAQDTKAANGKPATPPASEK